MTAIAPFRAVAGVLVLAVFAQYAAFLVFDLWWYLRLLLPCWPFLMLACGAVVEGVRLRGVFSPPPFKDGVNAAAGQANASRQAPSAAVTCATARESRVSFVIEGRLRGESPELSALSPWS